MICVMPIDAQLLAVGGLAALQGGYPFRTSIEESADGGILAVQMKDVDPDHGVNWSGATRTTLAGRKQPDWLKAGDVLFVSKGARFYAICIDEPPSAAVCSPHFFLLRVTPGVALLPAFLAWQMNQPPFQRQLQQAAEGSGQLSIRRPVLESLTLCVPSLADQHRIVALATLARSERQAFHQLMHNRAQQFRLLAEDLAQSAQTSH
jgi:hypothetical protein